MKFIFRLFCLVWVFMLIAACKDKNSFTIKSNPQHSGIIKKVYLLAADCVGKQLMDSINLSEAGEFQFRGITAAWCPASLQENPNMVKLYRRCRGQGFNLRTGWTVPGFQTSSGSMVQPKSFTILKRYPLTSLSITMVSLSPRIYSVRIWKSFSIIRLPENIYYPIVKTPLL